MMYATVILSYFIYVERHADIISARTSIGSFITKVSIYLLGRSSVYSFFFSTDKT